MRSSGHLLSAGNAACRSGRTCELCPSGPGAPGRSGSGTAGPPAPQDDCKVAKEPWPLVLSLSKDRLGESVDGSTLRQAQGSLPTDSPGLCNRPGARGGRWRRGGLLVLFPAIRSCRESPLRPARCPGAGGSDVPERTDSLPERRTRPRIPGRHSNPRPGDSSTAMPSSMRPALSTASPSGSPSTSSVSTIPCATFASTPAWAWPRWRDWSRRVVEHNHPLLPTGQDMWVMQRITRGVEGGPGEAAPTVLIETHAIPFASPRAPVSRWGPALRLRPSPGCLPGS